MFWLLVDCWLAAWLGEGQWWLVRHGITTARALYSASARVALRGIFTHCPQNLLLWRCCCDVCVFLQVYKVAGQQWLQGGSS